VAGRGDFSGGRRPVRFKVPSGEVERGYPIVSTKVGSLSNSIQAAFLSRAVVYGHFPHWAIVYGGLPL
jgi:hypothetical protein